MINYPRLAADAGRIVPNPDVRTGDLKIALFSAPADNQPSSRPTLYLAGSTPTPGWRRANVEISHAGRMQVVQTARRKSVLGYAATSLDMFENEDEASIEIVLHDADQWLVSCGDEDLELGDNLAVLGNRIIHFGEATPLGAGRFRLARLRGRAGTASGIGRHHEGEPFVLVERTALQAVHLPLWARGSPIHASAQNGSAKCSLTLAAGLETEFLARD